MVFKLAHENWGQLFCRGREYRKAVTKRAFLRNAYVMHRYVTEWTSLLSAPLFGVSPLRIVYIPNPLHACDTLLRARDTHFMFPVHL